MKNFSHKKIINLIVLIFLLCNTNTLQSMMYYIPRETVWHLRPHEHDPHEAYHSYKESTCFFCAIIQNKIDYVRAVMARYGPTIVNKPDDFGNTPLHYATDYNRQEIMRLLFKHKAMPNKRNILGYAPLHMACLRNHFKATQILLENHANPNITNFNTGETPLHCIDCKTLAIAKCTKILELFLKYKADPKKKNRQEEVPEIAKIVLGEMFFDIEDALLVTPAPRLPRKRLQPPPAPTPRPTPWPKTFSKTIIDHEHVRLDFENFTLQKKIAPKDTTKKHTPKSSHKKRKYYFQESATQEKPPVKDTSHEEDDEYGHCGCSSCILL